MFLRRSFYLYMLIAVFVIASGMLWPVLYSVGLLLCVLVVAMLIADVVVLYAVAHVRAQRECGEVLSLGEQSRVLVRVSNDSPLWLRIEVTDEAPVEWQMRHLSMMLYVPARMAAHAGYDIRPTRRGLYTYGSIRLFLSSRLGLAERRVTAEQARQVSVYPSFVKLDRASLATPHDTMREQGTRRRRKIGNHTEYEQIKEYVQGDDYRHINWKASARRHQLMVNVYEDEKSQQVYCVIDKGRLMQQAFAGMTIMDYSINAALMLSYVAIRRDDRAGLATFAADFDTFVPASRQNGQMQRIMNSLYRQETTFEETDYAVLCSCLQQRVNRRSLMVLFTSFASLSQLRRQLPYLRQLNRRHRLLVVFFADTDLAQVIADPAESADDYARRLAAEQMEYEKQMIVSHLSQQGIYSLLSAPQSLTVDVINKYIDMKRINIFS